MWYPCDVDVIYTYDVSSHCPNLRTYLNSLIWYSFTFSTGLGILRSHTMNYRLTYAFYTHFIYFLLTFLIKNAFPHLKLLFPHFSCILHLMVLLHTSRCYRSHLTPIPLHYTFIPHFPALFACMSPPIQHHWVHSLLLSHSSCMLLFLLIYSHCTYSELFLQIFSSLVFILI